MTESDPKWIVNKRKYNYKYRSINCRDIKISLNKNTDADLIEIYESIPNKAAWFKDCLREYAKRNK